MRTKGMVVVCLTMCVSATVALAAGDARLRELERMHGWRAVEATTQVPPEGLTFARDVATWKLESGTLRPLAPREDGFVPGFVVEGKGRFSMEVPDAFEVAPLRRFSGKAGIARVDEPFSNW